MDKSTLLAAYKPLILLGSIRSFNDTRTKGQVSSEACPFFALREGGTRGLFIFIFGHRPRYAQRAAASSSNLDTRTKNGLCVLRMGRFFIEIRTGHSRQREKQSGGLFWCPCACRRATAKSGRISTLGPKERASSEACSFFVSVSLDQSVPLTV